MNRRSLEEAIVAIVQRFEKNNNVVLSSVTVEHDVDTSNYCAYTTVVDSKAVIYNHGRVISA